MNVRHCVHGVTVVVDTEIAGWPTGAPSTDEWRLEIDAEGTGLNPLVRSGVPRWAWDGDTSVAEGRPVLTLTGGPEPGSATTFAVDWSARTIHVSFTHADAGGLVGSVEILNRWVLPVIARQQASVVALHASSVLTEFGAIVLAGDSGAGKSTLTAALCDQGATLLGDEPVLVEPVDVGSRVWPGEPALRLADPGDVDPERAATERAVPVEGTRLSAVRFGKSVLVPAAALDGTRPADLAALCLLEPRSDAAAVPVIGPITGPAVLTRLMDMRYNRTGGHAIARRDFGVIAAIAASATPIRTVRLPDDRGRVAEGARCLLDAVARSGGSGPESA